MIAALFIAVAVAAEPTLDARPFADGWVSGLAWTEVRVVLTGGEADTAGVVELTAYDDTVQVRRIVELPRGSVRALALPVAPGESGLPVAARFVRDGAPTLSQPLTWRRTEGPLLVAIGDHLGELGHLRRMGTDAHQVVVNVELDALPERSGVWQNARQVVWPRADTTGVSVVAQQALVDAVASGGRLLVTFGDGAGVGPGPLADALPVARQGVGLVDVGPLGAALGVAAPSAPLPGAIGTVRPGSWTIAGDPGAPLWALVAHGDGFLSWIGVDPEVAPIRAMAPGGEAWRSWLWLGEARPAVGRVPPEVRERLESTVDADFVGEGIGTALEESLGAVAAPPISLWLGFSAAFLACVGPIEALVLGRLRRRSWTWVTFPALSLLFFGLGATLGAKDRLRWNVGRCVTVIDVVPGAARAVTRRYFAVYTIERRDLVAVSGGPGGLIRPLEGSPGGMWSPRREDDGERGSLLWSTRAATTGFVHDAWVGPSPGALTLEPAGELWEVESTLPFEVDAFLCHLGGCWSLGGLAPGERRAEARPRAPALASPDGLPDLRSGTYLVGRAQGSSAPGVTGVDARWDTTTWLRYPIATPVLTLESP